MFSIKVNGFRGFNESYLDISDLNILIGENSGGKSSFIKLLLLLKQSMEVANKDKKINVSGHILDLGGFDSFINHSLENKSFDVSFIIDSDEYLNLFATFMVQEDEKKLEDFVDQCSYFINDTITLSFHFSREENELFTNYISIFSKNIGTLKIKIASEEKKEKIHFSALNNIDGELELDHVKHGMIKIKEKFSVLGFMLLGGPDPIEEYAKKNNIDNLLYEMGFLLISQNFITLALNGIKYINPIKFQPTRIVLKRDSSLANAIEDYETLINTLSSLIESHDDNSKIILNNFNKAIKEIGIAEEVKLESNANIPVSELKVKTAGVWNSIVDVGYGVGLQIPILLQAIISSVNESNDIIVIEQPEIHLHPALHSKFIEVLLKYSKGTKFIIETHSEHIIRKLQVFTKNNIIENDNIRIYYFKNPNGKFEISRHEIDQDGQLEPVFPKGFYDNSYTLSKELY